MVLKRVVRTKLDICTDTWWTIITVGIIRQVVRV